MLHVPSPTIRRLNHDLVVLEGPAVSIVVEASHGIPRILHWGAKLADPQADADALHGLMYQHRGNDSLTGLMPPTILPEQSNGWMGTPGLEGHRDGTDFSTKFEHRDLELAELPDGSVRLMLVGEDEALALRLASTLELTPSGLLRARACLTNDGQGVYTVDAMRLSLPLPSEAVELMDLAGRHLKERTPQRTPFTVGTHARMGRRGRTGSDASLVMAAGTRGFGFGHGEVWAIHTAWSGNHTTFAEQTITGAKVLGGGEYLLPGEVQLARGESYTTPWLYAAFGVGLDSISASFHAYLRSLPSHPTRPRPVTLNTWEAVYFEHSYDTLAFLAEIAADLGIERFVLDDGWFMKRRDDRAGLGDWKVDPEVWPQGLGPLADHVRSLGMEFGLWVEPEMVNLESQLAEDHPEWIMGPGERLPAVGRNQHLLNLSISDAYNYILESLSSLIGELGIACLKWDHNRDISEGGNRTTRQPAVHAQTQAVYNLMDELHRRHPGLEIESCASGGGRIDLEILRRTQRVWTSDCIDPLERQRIQRWTGLVLPNEIIGCHVGAPTAHTTHRTHTLSFRAVTALFGHFGIEWDLRQATPEQRADLKEWIALYKNERELLSTGHTVRCDYPSSQYWAHGVIAPDQSRALFAFVAVDTLPTTQPGRIRIRGLNRRSRYLLDPIGLTVSALAAATDGVSPWWDKPTVVSGSFLEDVGLPGPTLYPESAFLFRLAIQ